MERMLSGIKPTGRLTLGNYIGAIKNFVKYQDEYEMYIFIANLHALTTANDKDELMKNTYDIAALYLACGLDPKKTTIFIQSEVPQHGTLGYILACNSYMGELSRMTQYKDKASKEANINVGLFTYPILMAADILLYDPKFVPVGEDQKQHAELTRDIAIRYNNKFGKTFVIPDCVINKVGARVMSLSNPTKKMSKSEEDGDKGCIYLLDDISKSRKKIMSAITDSDMLVKYDPENKPGISNLMSIYSALTGKEYPEIEKEFEGCNYGTFKGKVADCVCAELEKIQTKYNEYINSDLLKQVLEEGRIKATKVAQETLDRVYDRMGIIK